METESSLKKQHKCPFAIKYSLIGYKGKVKLPKSFYKVHIMGYNLNHTCGLSNIFFKVAKNKAESTIRINLSSMNSILMLLKTNPSISTNSLRSFLEEHVTDDTSLNCVFIRIFRLRVAYFHATNPNYIQLTMDDARKLIKSTPIAEDEHKILDNPITRHNYNDILRKVLAEDSSTWELLAFLCQCKKKIQVLTLE